MCDSSIWEGWMVVNITKSKTDQLLQENESTIARMHTKLCPLAMYVRSIHEEGRVIPKKQKKII